MPRVLEKVERRLGEKLFLKGDRCVGPKCSAVRRAYPPGARSKKRRRGLSEYGELLREKQKVRYLYGLDDKEMKRYTQKAASRSGIFSENLMRLLERRLDNVLFRSGFMPARRSARNLVGHGHVLVNGRSVNVPSYLVKKGETVRLKEKIIGRGPLTDLDIRLKKYEPPAWLNVDKGKKEIEIVSLPSAQDSGVIQDITKIKEFYSR